MKTELAETPIENYIDSLRTNPYSLETAISDIIDNSIDANAKNIWIKYKWDKRNSFVSIIDDGIGISEKEFRLCMTLSGKGPNSNRHAKELGRFGLGLKTASFSQCKNLTVFSKNEKKSLGVRAWDLEFIKKKNQMLLITEANKSRREPVLEDLAKIEKKSGTIVLWQDIDKIIDFQTVEDQNEKSLFYAKFYNLKEHLSIYFHRFLISKKIKLFINDTSIEGWDPFYNKFTSPKASLLLTSNDDKISYLDSKISIESYVLPHHSHLTKEELDLISGPYGMSNHQGFYFYRNDRLILASHWPSYMKLNNEEHCRLSRIKVNIPNSLDFEFKLDYLKSTIDIPNKIKNRFKSSAVDCRKKATQVYRFRGNKEINSDRNTNKFVSKFWNLVKTRNGKFYFKIENKHPLISSLKNKLDNESKILLSQIFDSLSATIPIESARLAETDEQLTKSIPYEFEEEAKLIKRIEYQLNVYKELHGNEISNTEYEKLLKSNFDIGHYPELIQKVIKNEQNECK